MKRYVSLCTVLASALAGPLAFGQHTHAVPHTTTHVDQVRHGNHYHNVPHTTTHLDHVTHYGPDYVPHTTTHIDQLRHGNHYHNVPHTTTHYDARYPSTIYSPGSFYNYPNVINSSRILSTNLIPSTSYAVPSTGTTIVANKIPTGNSIPSVVNGKSFKIYNPRDTQGSISYTLNEIRYTMNPGESQTVPMDRDWILKFDNGLGKQVGYRLTEGSFEFSVSRERGWDLGRRQEQTAPTPPSDTPSLPANSIPFSSTTPAIPQSSVPVPTLP